MGQPRFWRFLNTKLWCIVGECLFDLIDGLVCLRLFSSNCHVIALFEWAVCFFCPLPCPRKAPSPGKSYTISAHRQRCLGRRRGFASCVRSLCGEPGRSTPHGSLAGRNHTVADEIQRSGTSCNVELIERRGTAAIVIACARPAEAFALTE